MSDLFDGYFEELDQLLNEYDDQNDSEIDTKKLDSALKESDEILSQMKIEVVSISDKGRKQEVVAKMNGYKEKVAVYRKTLLLSGGSSGGGGGGRGAERTDDQKAANSLDVLNKARQQLIESQEVGNNVMGNLAQQRETINRSTAKVQEVNQNLSYSNKLLTRMGKWWRG